MMMTAQPSPRVTEFLARYAALSDAERRRLQRTPEFAYMMARLRFRDDEPVPAAQMDLALDLAVRYPHSLDYYRGRAEEAGRRRCLTERLAASAPFKISAGA
jgi:hypothetical protein